MKGKGKGDRTSKHHHDECPLQFPNLKLADHVRLCPRYSAGRLLLTWCWPSLFSLLYSVQTQNLLSFVRKDIQLGHIVEFVHPVICFYVISRAGTD